jgi:hypothetical protein
MARACGAGAAQGLGRCSVRGPRAQRWSSSASAGAAHAAHTTQRAAALLSEPAMTRRQRTGDSGERRLTGAEMTARRDRDGRAASEAVGTARRRFGRRRGRRGSCRKASGASEAVGTRRRGRRGARSASGECEALSGRGAECGAAAVGTRDAVPIAL